MRKNKRSRSSFKKMRRKKERRGFFKRRRTKSDRQFSTANPDQGSNDKKFVIEPYNSTHSCSDCRDSSSCQHDSMPLGAYGGMCGPNLGQHQANKNEKPKKKVGLSHIINEGIEQIMNQMGETPVKKTQEHKLTLPSFHTERDPELTCELFDEGKQLVINSDLTHFMPCKPEIELKRKRCTITIKRDDKTFTHEVSLPCRVEAAYKSHIRNDILEIQLKKIEH